MVHNNGNNGKAGIQPGEAVRAVWAQRLNGMERPAVHMAAIVTPAGEEVRTVTADEAAAIKSAAWDAGVDAFLDGEHTAYNPAVVMDDLPTWTDLRYWSDDESREAARQWLATPGMAQAASRYGMTPEEWTARLAQLTEEEECALWTYYHDDDSDMTDEMERWER